MLVVTCIECGSERVFVFRLDQDWAYGSGRYYRVNPDECYTENDLELDSADRPDIEVNHCRECGRIWA